MNAQLSVLNSSCFEDQVRKAVMKDTKNKAPEDYVQQAIAICKELALSPTRRQICFMVRYDGREKKNVFSHMITVDGLRTIAERSGKYQGQEGPFWCGEDGVWRDVWLDHKKPPVAAKVGVYKQGFQAPLYAVAKFEEYKQTTQDGGLTMMWKKMPDLMVAKCAESLALRKAFPDELGGIYSHEEMMQSFSEGGPVSQKEIDQAKERIDESIEEDKEKAIQKEFKESKNQLIQLCLAYQVSQEEFSIATGIDGIEEHVKDAMTAEQAERDLTRWLVEKGRMVALKDDDIAF